MSAPRKERLSVSSLIRTPKVGQSYRLKGGKQQLPSLAIAAATSIGFLRAMSAFMSRMAAVVPRLIGDSGEKPETSEAKSRVLLGKLFPHHQARICH